MRRPSRDERGRAKEAVYEHPVTSLVYRKGASREDKFHAERRPCALLTRNLLPDLEIGAGHFQMPPTESGVDVAFSVDRDQLDFQVIRYVGAGRPHEQVVEMALTGAVRMVTGRALWEWDSRLRLLAEYVRGKKGDKADSRIHLVVHDDDDDNPFLASHSTPSLPTPFAPTSWASVSVVRGPESVVVACSDGCPAWLSSRLGEVIVSKPGNPMAFDEDPDAYKELINDRRLARELNESYRARS
ncbi:MAG: hypothetical protein AB1758_12775 [Candidatus Eremiobacterota bacterium]